MEVLTTRPTKAVFRMREACKYLGLSPTKLREYSDLGAIPSVRRGTHRVFNIEVLDRFRQSDFQLNCERPVGKE